MEFEDNPPVTDEQRLRAANRTLTIKPLADNIRPDDKKDSEVVAGHLANGPLANTPEESEDSESASLQSKSLFVQKKRSKMAIFSGTVAICLIAAIVVYRVYYS